MAEPWDAMHQDRRIKTALLATGCDADTVFYALRHSHISITTHNSVTTHNTIITEDPETAGLLFSGMQR